MITRRQALKQLLGTAALAAIPAGVHIAMRKPAPRAEFPPAKATVEQFVHDEVIVALDIETQDPLEYIRKHGLTVDKGYVDTLRAQLGYRAPCPRKWTHSYMDYAPGDVYRFGPSVEMQRDCVFTELAPSEQETRIVAQLAADEAHHIPAGNYKVTMDRIERGKMVTRTEDGQEIHFSLGSFLGALDVG